MCPRPFGGHFSFRRENYHRFAIPDFQGHTRQLTDAAQAATDAYLFDAWGRELAASGATWNMLRAFAEFGYWRDGQNRLYVRARHLRPEVGRWLSRDPAAMRPGDLYAYPPGEAPTRRSDPSGLRAANDTFLSLLVFLADYNIQNCLASSP